MKTKQLWIKIRNNTVTFLKYAVRKNPITKQRLLCCASYIRRSWKSIAVVLPVFLLLYYCIGGYVTNNITKDTMYEVKAKDGNLHVVEAGIYLINSQVDDNMWTPNLPFIFPGFVLDNMPSYQTGIVQSVKIMTEALNSVYKNEELAKAKELLNYPPNVWILSKGENLALAPSSGAQYRKAKKELMKFNDDFHSAASENKKVLLKILQYIEKDLNKMSDNLDTQIREYSSSWVDLKADDVFYFNQGKIYGHYTILKSAFSDFKTYVIDTKQYETVTSLLKIMQDAIILDPKIIRNGDLNAVITPNHLSVLDYNVSKAMYYIYKIRNNISRSE